MGDIIFLATMLEEQSSRGAPYLHTVLLRPPSSLYAKLIIEHSLASSQSISAMTFHKTSGMTRTIGNFVLLLPNTGQRLQAGVELVPMSRVVTDDNNGDNNDDNTADWGDLEHHNGAHIINRYLVNSISYVVML